MQSKNINPCRFLGADGPVARRLKSYEERTEQIHLAQAIDKAFGQSKHLIAEAGTGVGKSFAYIVPAVNWAVQNDQKVVISTYTISLQEQLARKDIPFIKDVSGIDFTAVLAKGRGNYLCWRRLEQARRRGPTLFDNSEHIDLLEELYLWALQSQDGSLSDLPQPPPGEVWEMVCSDSHTCIGKACKKAGSCFYQLARRRLFGANLIIVNHALLFSDLALRRQGGKILPNYKLVVLDEAHNIENVAGKHFGLRLSNFQVNFLLNRLFNPKNQKGVLAAHIDDVDLSLLDKSHQANDSFFSEVLEYHDARLYGTGQSGGAGGDNGRIKSPDAFANTLSGPLHELGGYLHNLGKSLNSEQDSLEIEAYGKRCRDFAADVHMFVSQKLEKYVYWIEAGQRFRHRRSLVCAAPLNIGPILQEVLFEPCDSVIMTSATLSTGGTKEKENNEAKGFDFFTSRLGLADFNRLQLGSPFDYPNQVKVYVEAYLPDARDRQEEFLAGATEAIKKYLLQTEGKAFVLFTSYKQLQQVESNLTDFCRLHKLTLLAQGRGKDRSTLLNQFRSDTNSVLLGTDSFWQGVDVPGQSLSSVIIVKLPFSVPDHPLLQARLEQIRNEGNNPFFGYQLPEAILKFKQGFGRLIRTKTDKGIVVILDPRVVTKNYGRAFLNVLPQCPVTIVKKPQVPTNL